MAKRGTNPHRKLASTAAMGVSRHEATVVLHIGHDTLEMSYETALYTSHVLHQQGILARNYAGDNRTEVIICAELGDAETQRKEFVKRHDPTAALIPMHTGFMTAGKKR